MVGKNNSYLRESKSNDHFKRFSLRKLNIGVVSVAIAAGFYFGNGATAQAATTETSTAIKTEQVEQQHSNTTEQVEQQHSNTTEQVEQQHSNTTEQVEQQHSNTIVAATASASNSKSAIQNGTDSDSKAITASASADSGLPIFDLVTLPTESSNNQKPQSNVDLSLWKWQTADSTKGYNGIKLTGYTGDVDETATIYVPNNVDFIKAGKIKAGQSVYLGDLSYIRNCRRLIIDNHDGGKVIFVRNPTGSIPTFESEYLEYIDVSGADTHLLTDMSRMFYGSPNLKRIVGLENFDTSHVQSFELMFGWDPQLMDIGDLSKWDVSKVENFNEMFQLDKNLTNIGNLDNWDVSQAKSFEMMFMGTEKLESIGSLKDWQVKNVTDMPGMFLLSSIVGVDMSNWDVSSLRDVSYMFAYNYNPHFTNLELPNFSKAKLETWLQAFLDDNYLENINISGWDFVDDLNYNKYFHDAGDAADNLFDKWLSTSGVNGLTVNTIGAKWPSDLDLMPENSDFDYNPKYGVTGDNGIGRFTSFEGADEYTKDIKYSEKPTPLVVLTDNQTLLGYNKQRSESNRPNEITLVDKNGKVVGQYQMPIFYTSIDSIKKQIGQYEDEFTQNYRKQNNDPKATFTFTLVDPETHQELTEEQIENLTPAQLVMATYLVRQNAKATVDKSQLQKDIDQGTQIKQNDKYRNADADQQKALDDAIKNGQDVLNDPKADQKKVDDADKAITDALNGLKGQPTDKSQLQKDIDQGTQIKQNDKYRNADADQQKALDDAIKNGQDVLNDPKADQKKVDDADKAIKATIQNAQAQLDKDNSQPTTPTTPAKPDSGKDDNKGTTTPTNPTKPSKGDDHKGDKPSEPTNPAKPSDGKDGNKGTDNPAQPTKPSKGDDHKGTTTPTTPAKPSDSKDEGNKGNSQPTTPTTPTTPAKPDSGKDDNKGTTTPTNPTKPSKGDDHKGDKPSEPTNPAKPSDGKDGNKGTDNPTQPTKPSKGDDHKGTTTPTTPAKPSDSKDEGNKGNSQPTTPTTPTTPAKPDHGNASISGQAGHKPATSDHGSQTTDSQATNKPTIVLPTDGKESGAATQGQYINVVSKDSVAAQAGIQAPAAPETTSVTFGTEEGTMMTREEYKAQQANLPQTGNDNDKAVVALGVLAGMFGLGLASKGKKEF